MTFGEIVNVLATCFTLLVGWIEMSIPCLIVLSAEWYSISCILTVVKQSLHY